MKVGDLVKCVEDAWSHAAVEGVGIVIELDAYAPGELSVHVQWIDESLWYEKKDLEVINESR